MVALVPGRIYYGELAPGEWPDEQGFLMPSGKAQQVLHLKHMQEYAHRWRPNMSLIPSTYFLLNLFH